MTRPPDPGDPNGGAEEAHPSPGPFLALSLAIGASLATTLLFLAFAPTMDVLASRALAVVLGVGAIGALAAVHIPPPHAERLGFRGLDRAALLATLLLVPVALLSSELDNIARAVWGGRPTFSDPPEPRSAVLWLQALAVFVGIEPLLEEWFFRGVLQQGSVDRLGRAGGVAWCAFLFGLYAALGRAQDGAEAAAIVLQSTVLGLSFGFLRLATGSLLAPVLLHAAINAVALLGAPWLPIPGFTGPGDHTDPLLLLAAAGSCGVAFRLLLSRMPSNPDPETGAEETARGPED